LPFAVWLKFGLCPAKATGYKQQRDAYGRYHRDNALHLYKANGYLTMPRKDYTKLVHVVEVVRNVHIMKFTVCYFQIKIHFYPLVLQSTNVFFLRNRITNRLVRQIRMSR
jgi:hypothetical protein